MQDTDQRTLIKKDKWILVLSLIFLLILVFTNYGGTKEIVYDCRDAHWHPDVPVDVKKECQKIMYEEWKKLQEEEIRKKFINT